MRHAWSLGAPIAVVTQQAASEAAQLADIVIAPQTGPEAVAGLTNPKARLAQRQILNMVSTGLAIRDGRVYSNLRVDLQADTPHWAERQVAIVMAATDRTRSEAKSRADQLPPPLPHRDPDAAQRAGRLARAGAADQTSRSSASCPARSPAQRCHSRPLSLSPGAHQRCARLDFIN